MSDPVLGPGTYALGVLWILVVGGSLTVAARSVRRSHLRGWTPMAALLGQVVVGLAVFTLVGEVVGALRLLRPVPMAAATALASLGVWWLARRFADPHPPVAVEHGPPSPRRERWLAGAAVVVIGAQWISHAADALDTGMTHPDTLWYHGPYSARFLQLGSLGDLGGLGYSQARYYPLGSELLHSLVALPFERDFLSPFVNLGFAALTLLAAAVLGARWGASALAVLATTVVLGLPVLAGTQPGQASNDVIAIAFVLSALALVVQLERQPAAMAIGGLALGMAAGTKMTVLPLCGLIAGVVVVTAWRGGARRAAGWWVGGILLTAGFWPLRNLVLAGTPVPFFDFRIGPWHHAAATDTGGPPSLVRAILDDTWWAYSAGITNGLGSAWPFVLLLLVGAPLVVMRGPTSLRWVAIAAAFAALAYPITPYTGSSSFQFNLRYLTPALTLGAILLVISASSLPRLRRVAAAVLLGVLVVNLFASHHERVAAWPGHWPAVAVVVVAVVLALVAWNEVHQVRPVVVGTVLVLAVVAGWPAQRHYLAQRYVDIGLPDDEVHSILREATNRRVDLLGTPESYPMFGGDLSNTVVDHSDDLILYAARPDDPCRHWREVLRDADLIALSSQGFVMIHFTPRDRELIFESDPAVSVLYADDERALYRVDGRLDPDACPPVTAATSAP